MSSLVFGRWEHQLHHSIAITTRPYGGLGFKTLCEEWMTHQHTAGRPFVCGQKAFLDQIG
jgi:hypothetical protein